MNKLKFALYARVSTSIGDQTNLNQIVRLREFAESKGFELRRHITLLKTLLSWVLSWMRPFFLLTFLYNDTDTIFYRNSC